MVKTSTGTAEKGQWILTKVCLGQIESYGDHVWVTATGYKRKEISVVIYMHAVCMNFDVGKMDVGRENEILLPHK